MPPGHVGNALDVCQATVAWYYRREYLHRAVRHLYPSSADV